MVGIGEWKKGYIGAAAEEPEDWFGKLPEPEKLTSEEENIDEFFEQEGEGPGNEKSEPEQPPKFTLSLFPMMKNSNMAGVFPGRSMPAAQLSGWIFHVIPGSLKSIRRKRSVGC